VHDASGNDEALPGSEFNRTAFEIDKQLSLDDIKEFVVIVVLVPVILTLDDSQAHHRLVDLAQRLIEPLVFAGVRESPLIDDFHRRIEDIQAGFVWIGGRRISHGKYLPSVRYPC
jgi:hypothetical protein